MAALVLLDTVSAFGYTQFIGFGASEMDSGYFRYTSTGGSPSLPPSAPIDTIDRLISATVTQGGTGAFMGPGVVDTVQLAEKFGLTANPVTMPGGGTNYANGSAQTVSTTREDNYANGLYNNVPVVTQIVNYLTSVHGAANPDALYMISAGGNDLTWLNAHLNTVLPAEYLNSLAEALTSSIASLHGAGARHLLVLNSYAYSTVVTAEGTVPPANAALVEQAALYAADLWSGLHAAGIPFIPADVESVLKYVSQNPTKFGFTPWTVLASNPACGATSALLCTPAQLVSPDAEQTHLWSDAHHLTTAGQTIEADYLYSLLTAPTAISLLPETVVHSGLSRTAAIQRQAELAGPTRGTRGIAVWATAGYGYATTETESSFPSDSGNPFQGTVGADYQTTTGMVIGGTFSAGSQSQDFSTGGDFHQNNQTLGLYSSYQDGLFWGNAVASYSFLQNEIARAVQLGLFTDRNSGETDGRALTLALRGGRNFTIGRLTTGPLAGGIFQEVRIDSFTEQGITGVTALSFNSQTRDSLVTQLGWRGSMDLGVVQPFAEATWNHEWKDDERTVTTTLTTVSAPSYDSLATPVASDWGNATIGLSYQISPRAKIWGAFSTMFGNWQDTDYGGEFGLRVSF